MKFPLKRKMLDKKLSKLSLFIKHDKYIELFTLLTLSVQLGGLFLRSHFFQSPPPPEYKIFKHLEHFYVLISVFPTCRATKRARIRWLSSTEGLVDIVYIVSQSADPSPFWRTSQIYAKTCSFLNLNCVLGYELWRCLKMLYPRRNT